MRASPEVMSRPGGVLRRLGGDALVYGLGIYPDTGERVINPIDFVKYGFLLWILSLVVVWLTFMIVFPIVGFPEGILETATQVLVSGAAG